MNFITGFTKGPVDIRRVRVKPNHYLTGGLKKPRNMEVRHENQWN